MRKTVVVALILAVALLFAGCAGEKGPASTQLVSEQVTPTPTIEATGDLGDLEESLSEMESLLTLGEELDSSEFGYNDTTLEQGI